MWLTELFLLLRVTDISAAVIAWPDPEVQRLKKKKCFTSFGLFWESEIFYVRKK